MATIILGISAFYHDSAAALIIDGEIIAAAEEERFTRIKHDASFPENAIKYVLEEGGITYGDVTVISFYDKPMLKFERLLETYHAFAPKGLISFVKAVPVWLKDKLFIRKLIRKRMNISAKAKIPILFPEHHLSHAASAFYPSPFDEAAILTIDGVGEWATTTISYGRGNQITVLKELHFPHSVGLLYSAFTYYLGFKVNSGEYKLMGLAPYGDGASMQTAEFKQKILAELVDVSEDGSILLNMRYFDFATGLTMTNCKKWQELFGVSKREPESEISQTYMNFALAAQQVTESIITLLAETAQKITGSRNLVMAGGVALNCVANSKIAKTGLFNNIWIQPAAGDSGGALGAAHAAYYIWAKNERKSDGFSDAMKNAYLGPEYDDKHILNMTRRNEIDYTHFENFDELTAIVSEKIAGGNVIGWFQGKMEFGPRALGNRSILGDPRNPEMQKIINVKIKAREEFRPFAPSVLLEDVSKYFETTQKSPYMLFVASLNKELQKKTPANYNQLNLYDRLHYRRSEIPAVTHVDYSARIQTVAKEDNPRFWQLITDFKKLTGCSLLINTSFNLRGEPIVCTPEDAYRCFMHTEMDYLVIGNYLFDKKRQTPMGRREDENMRFQLD
ncbi:MAG TPA: carbamoyltransferase [Mucilaginibacter sp.]